ncbi:ABC transporter substrate-binding protein [Methanospirillum hungatei]|uniref:ABC transporter substrate-binding protein n=1 Tax=Methanospirillum hungatei TaxID=2203 RepID=UPI0026EF411E|nr:ABC transporter substrate-binding protein [Methanospirillum hungatei]MCA1917340.1 ABC transporter substrate-binding protein [Methanospirillum hungatei]
MVNHTVPLHTSHIILVFFLISGFLIPLPVFADNKIQNVEQDQVYPEYATGFSVEYHEDYKVVTVTKPWRGSDESYTYVLVKPGVNPPHLGKGEEIITIPSERFVSLSSTYLPYLPILGITSSLKGVTNPNTVYTPEVRNLIQEGKVLDVSGGGSGMATGINLETLIDLNPDLVMTYATGQPEYDAHPKLQEAGIPVVLNAEYMEEDPLGRAEWIKFISVFFNREKEANAYFEEIKKEYQSLEKSVHSRNDTYPTVFVNNNWHGTWNMAGGRSFVAELLRDAGADYLWSDDTTTGSIPLDFEIVYDRAQKADYWLNPGTAMTLQELLGEDARYSEFAAVKSKKIYNNNARVNAGGGNDYWESGVAHPEVILKDLIKIFHPEVVSDHNLVYYRHLD